MSNKLLDNARHIPCDMLFNPKDEIYAESIRRYQGCPTIAITRGGRIFLGWYAGGTREPHMDNYNLLVMSDDGVNFSEPILIIPSSKENLVHALDIQLWTAPDGALYVFWMQNNVCIATDGVRPEGLSQYCPWISVEGYDFPDFEHAVWVSVCRNPDADVPVFEAPRYVCKGFLRCKPTVLTDGRWLFFCYDQLSDRYGCVISDDCGKTFTHYYGAKKCPTCFDEGMAYQLRDGSIRMLARTDGPYMAESVSYDNAQSWQEARYTDILHSNTRLYVSRTKSGRVMLIHNDCERGRTNLTVRLSEDDGASWKYVRTVDPRAVSYPDADFRADRIYLTYDRERTGAKEILLVDFSEEDVMNEDYEFTPRIISKPRKN